MIALRLMIFSMIIFIVFQNNTMLHGQHPDNTERSNTPNLILEIENKPLYPYQPLQIKLTLTTGDQSMQVHYLNHMSFHLYLGRLGNFQRVHESREFWENVQSNVYTIEPLTTEVFQYSYDPVTMHETKSGRKRFQRAIQHGSYRVFVIMEHGKARLLNSNIIEIKTTEPQSAFAKQMLVLVAVLEHARDENNSKYVMAAKRELREHLLAHKDWHEYAAFNLYLHFDIETRIEQHLTQLKRAHRPAFGHQGQQHSSDHTDEIQKILNSGEDLGYYAPKHFDWDAFFKEAKEKYDPKTNE